MDRGADIGAAGADELSAAEQARAAGNAAGADDLVAAGDDGRSRRAARTDDLRAGEYVPPLARPNTSCAPPEMCAPSSVPPERMISVPPARMIVGSANPPEETISLPPPETVR
jgi:hypothetical protein